MPGYQHNDRTEPFPEQLITSGKLIEAAQKAIALAQGSESGSLLSVTIPFEKIDPLAILEITTKNGEFQFYWEHPDDKLSLAAGDALITLKADGATRFEDISSQIEDLQSRTSECSEIGHSLAGVHFLGGFSFFDDIRADEWEPFSAANFVVPEWMIVLDGELSMLTLNCLVKADDTADELCDRINARFAAINQCVHSSIRDHGKPEIHTSAQPPTVLENSDAFPEWNQNIKTAKSQIQAGEFSKIVLSRRLNVRLSGSHHHTRIVNNLRREYPSCFTFMFRPAGSSAFIGSTPERLVSIRSNHLLTEGLAGSISRGASATEDAILEKRLLNSAKDLEEHNIVVSSIVRRLGVFSNEIHHPARPGIKKFTNVQHLYTPISAWMDRNYNPFRIIRELHPTPAVGGSPGRKVLDKIPSMESYDRGWYAGPVGWLNSKGRGDFVVAIRSGLITAKEAFFYAGCGIVEDSDARSEWEETKLKLIPMLTAVNHA